VRPSIVAWAAHHGVPAWLVPDYLVLVGIGTVLAAWLTLRQSKRDGARVRGEARVLLLVYLAALAGGYLFEALRAIPEAIAERSISPLFTVGRAAYGGLLCAMAALAISCRATRLSAAALFDRVSVGSGLVFALVRTGCFLAGCDYGVPTASILGVRFPPGSLAANDHVGRGWIRSGAPTLPVHPTELYEAVLGLVAAAVAWVAIRSTRRRDGRVFTVWLATYALGRFTIEFLRGDVERGAWAGLSTAQWVSCAIVLALAGYWIKATDGPRSTWRDAHAGEGEPTLHDARPQ
jgi:prolipoprotein diacylglyceryltransferase